MLCHRTGPDCLTLCGSRSAMPRGEVHYRGGTYSLYAPLGIRDDRDSPGGGGVPRAVPFFSADHSAEPPNDGVLPYTLPMPRLPAVKLLTTSGEATADMNCWSCSPTLGISSAVRR